MRFALFFLGLGVFVSGGGLLGVGGASQAWAHPVSYKGAWSLMSFNDKDMNEVHLTYSFTPRLAGSLMFLNLEESEFVIPHANFLVKRWNNDDSQGNIYLSLGSGVETVAERGYSAHMGTFVADWESRKFYSSFEHLYIDRDFSSEAFSHSKLRLGFAPFLAEYSDLNVWFITQFDRDWLSDDGVGGAGGAGVGRDESVRATQFMRFYIKNVLWEIGAGFDGNFAFNFMIHL